MPQRLKPRGNGGLYGTEGYQPSATSHALNKTGLSSHWSGTASAVPLFFSKYHILPTLCSPALNQHRHSPYRQPCRYSLNVLPRSTGCSTGLDELCDIGHTTRFPVFLPHLALSLPRYWLCACLPSHCRRSQCAGTTLRNTLPPRTGRRTRQNMPPPSSPGALQLNALQPDVLQPDAQPRMHGPRRAQRCARRLYARAALRIPFLCTRKMLPRTRRRPIVCMPG